MLYQTLDIAKNFTHQNYSIQKAEFCTNDMHTTTEVILHNVTQDIHPPHMFQAFLPINSQDHVYTNQYN